MKQFLRLILATILAAFGFLFITGAMQACTTRPQIIQREVEITTSPPGARVIVWDQSKARVVCERTPCTADFGSLTEYVVLYALAGHEPVRQVLTGASVPPRIHVEFVK